MGRSEALVANELRFHTFGTEDPVSKTIAEASAGKRDPRFRYVASYLRGLGAASVVEETGYFDRDYLSEYAAYYATSAAGYGNVCSRLHFFSSPVSAERLRAAQAGKTDAHDLQDSYLGFLVWRPLPFAPIGRTVLRWYPGEVDGPPGIIAPNREYRANLAGLTLRVKGLEWQQQDAAVSRCATIALWSMLHSSGFDEHHAVPTTAAVSVAAHDQVSLGHPPFQGNGLTAPQMCGAVHALGFSPVLVPGDRLDANGNVLGFSAAYFAGICSAFILSGYAIVLTGTYQDKPQSRHAVCLVGYHPTDAGNIDAVYLHDDNLGPAARFVPEEQSTAPVGRLVLRREPPSCLASDSDPVPDFSSFVPLGMLVAVHPEIRMSASRMWSTQNRIGDMLRARIPGGIEVRSRFMRARDYLGSHMDTLFAPQPRAVARERMTARSLSLFVLVVRASLKRPEGPVPLAEWVFDTTAGYHEPSPFACLCTHAGAATNLLTFAAVVNPFQ